MSKHTQAKRVTIPSLLDAKAKGRKISAITCYDVTFARLIDQTEIDIVLVGDSLGNVILGYENTLPVTLDEVCHHARAVGRGLTKPLLCVDMPFMSYQVSVEQAVTNAGRIMKETGAHAVKIEGGQQVAPVVKALTSIGIPVMGHLGFTPQSVHQLGGSKVQGRTASGRDLLLRDAQALAEAGCFSLVLELVPQQLAAEVTRVSPIPVIGIGAGAGCDGQIIVLYDILGLDSGFRPKFLKVYADLGSTVQQAVAAYDREVKAAEYPTAAHSFD
jgi:3-methyl-2-oxobutanoate hydroxymethyltransferase